MSRLTLLAAILAALTLGCGDNHEHGDRDASNEAGGGSDKVRESATEPDESGHEIETSISMLEDADQELARAQKTCPISDRPLGGMGTPLKVEVKGKTVFLCCPGCKKEILKDPDKYLAKLK